MPNARYGIAAGQEVMTSEGTYPRLKLKGGERARFHFLTSGDDPWFLGTKFHRFVSGEGPQAKWREIVCLAEMTQGEDACKYCDSGDTGQVVNRFAQWVKVLHILHTADNPDQQAASWGGVKVKVAGGDRIMFKEVFTEEKDADLKLLQLSAGRAQQNFRQFSAAWTQHGDLRKHLYEVERVGEGMETFYLLRALKAEPLPKGTLERTGVKALPAIGDIFAGSVSFAVGGSDSVLGEDQLDGTGVGEDLPVESEELAVGEDLI